MFNSFPSHLCFSLICLNYLYVVWFCSTALSDCVCTYNYMFYLCYISIKNYDIIYQYHPALLDHHNCYIAAIRTVPQV